MRIIKKHSITSNTKLIQNCQTKLRTYPGKFLGTHKSYNQSSKRCLLCLNEKLARGRQHAKRKIQSDKQVQAQEHIHASQL